MEGNTKRNLKRKVTHPTDPVKKCILRVTTKKNYKELPEDSTILLTVNRSQRRNLKTINNNSTVVLLEEQVVNSIELYNNFIDKSNLDFTRTNTGVEIEVGLVDTFIEELRNYITKENGRATSEVLTEEILEEVEDVYLLYEDLLKYEFYLDRRFAWYRNLHINENTNQLYFNKINNPPTYITIENLIGCRCKKPNQTSKRVTEIILEDSKYKVICH